MNQQPRGKTGQGKHKSDPVFLCAPWSLGDAGGRAHCNHLIIPSNVTCAGSTCPLHGVRLLKMLKRP